MDNREFRTDREKNKAVGCPVLDSLGGQHAPVPRIFAPGGLNLSSDIDRHSTARAFFPQVLLNREARTPQKGPAKSRTALNYRRTF